MNIRFEYLYRDGANYKQFGEVIFSNPSAMDLAKVDEQIRKQLIDNEWFYPAEWGLKDLHYFAWDDELDHLFHEYIGIFPTDEPATEMDISAFLQKIKCGL
ncbi:MAG: hypothetical protein JST70_02955 [Bacteroidetes bacterium]|nr:hypothetical protein [Bacteroidota bacterium]